MVRFFKRLLLVLLFGGGLLAVAAVIVLLPKYREYEAAAEACDLGELDRIPAISEVFDAAGQRYSRLEGEARYVVPYAEISPNFINALLAREDARFHEHSGVDFTGIGRAALRNLAAGEVKEGASTITQQLARNTFDLGDDRWRRKFIEVLLARRIERTVGKEKILEAYANRIYFGMGMYGVETAARACFGKPAKDLSLSEAAILAGLIRSPNRLSPLKDSAVALGERDQVLARMEELAMITPAEAAAARAEPVPAGKQRPPRVQENYAMDAVMRDLEVLLPKDVIDRGGLRIHTTIDRRLQLLAETAVDAKLTALESEKGWPHPTRAAAAREAKPGEATPTESAYVQGALVAIDNETGGIRAIVGGRNFGESPYNRAVLARRQVGSTFKPFVYAAAFQRGLLPGTLLDDGAIAEGELGAASRWAPKNSDGDSLGLQPAAIGLIRSRNTMTIRAGEFATRAAVRDLAAKAGFGAVPDGPAIYLGAFESTLKDVTAAYTTFANGGTRWQPYIIDHIEDRSGRTIYKATRAELRCVPPGVNYLVNELLREVITNGTATTAKALGLKVPAAGKTGTTDDYKDAWFVGYTTRLTCGVWVGMDRPTRIADRGYGSTLALPIWVDFVQSASSWKYDAGDFVPRVALQPVDLCRVSSGAATAGCTAAGATYRVRLPADAAPRAACPTHGGTWVGGAPAGPVAFPAEPTGVPVARATLAADSTPSVGESVPVARAEPVAVGAPVAGALPAEPAFAPAAPAGEAGDGYRVIRTEGGLQFQNEP